MIDKKKAEVRRQVADLSERMEKLRKMRRLLGSEEWAESMGPWLRDEIASLSRRLEVIDLKPVENTAARGMIASWRILESLHDTTVKRMEAIADKAATLQKQLERWHTRGHEDLGTAAEAASKLAEQRRQT